MKLLAIDTATEQCSVALLQDGQLFARQHVTPRGHADLILPMIDAVLAEAGLSLTHLDALAFGRGPGSFTGVRIAVGVVQGLGFGADLPVVPISDLAAVAQQCVQPALLNKTIMVCMDARMGEVYWANFKVEAQGLVQAVTAEQVSAPDTVPNAALSQVVMAAGTGFAAYPALAASYAAVPVHPHYLPCATAIAQLAVREIELGHTVSASEALPIYIRNQVATVPHGT